MTPQTARKTLGVTGRDKTEKIQSAYIKKVRALQQSEDFETHLKNLNIARDTLLDTTDNSRELSTVLASELAEIKRKQNEIINLNDAKEELRASLVLVKSQKVAKHKGFRDSVGLMSALSAAAFFGKDRLLELFPSPTGTAAELELALLIVGSLCAVSAFVFHRRSEGIAAKLDAVNQNLMRELTIQSMLNFVFEDQDQLEGDEFNWRLRWFIERTAEQAEHSVQLWDRESRPKSLSIVLVDGYTDFLVKTEKVKLETSTFGELTFSR